MSAFAVGDLVMVVNTKINREYLGHCFTVTKAPYTVEDFFQGPVLVCDLDLLVRGRDAIAGVNCLLKINPPPDFVNEQERDELTA